MTTDASPGAPRTCALATEADTCAFGRRLAQCVQRGDFIVLEGDLGAGKTTLIRALARGLGLADEVPVTSPTFTLLQDYPTDPLLVHADLYRLGDVQDLAELELGERIRGNALVVVEWGERFSEWLGVPDLVLHLAFAGRAARELSARAETARGKSILDAVFE